MFRQLVRPLRLFAQAFLAADTPRQLALGFALGMMIGLVPKGNLTAVGLLLLLLATRVNLGTGVLAAVLFSWVSVVTDPFAHRIGQAILTAEKLQSSLASVYDLPLMPWTGFNNTVVMGSLLLGLLLFYPAYHLSHLAFERWRPWVVEKLKEYKVVQFLVGSEVAAGWRML